MDNIKYIDSSGLGTLAAGAGLRFDLEAEGHSIHVTDKGE